MRATTLEMLCRGCVLPAARFLVSCWTWLYTAPLPEHARTTRREEIRSDVHDQMEHGRETGVGDARIGFDVLRRMGSGAWDDMSWALPQMPSPLAVHLAHLRPSPWAISYMAVAVLINVCLALSDWNHLWPAWPLANGAVLAATLLLQKQRQPWARGILLSGASFTIFLALGVGILATWNSGPPWPLPYSLMLEAVLMMPLVILALLVASMISGVPGFEDNRRWLVLLCVPVIGFVLWGSGTALDGSPENLIEVSAATAVLSAGWAALAAIFACGSRVVSYAVLEGATVSARLVSKGVAQG